MQIETVITNLQRTIAGKRMLLDTYENPLVNPYPAVVKLAMISVLQTNIAELERILADLQQVK